MKRSSGGPRSPDWRGRADRAAEPEGEGRRQGPQTAAGPRTGWNVRQSAGRGRRDEDDAGGEGSDGGSERDRDDGRGPAGDRAHDYDARGGDKRGQSRDQARDERRDHGDDAAGRQDGDESDTGRLTRPQPSAYGKALGLLSRREHSGRELKRKLARTGYTADETSEALDRLQEQSFQSDDRFAGLLVRSRVAQGQGPRRIRAELRSHGIDDAAAQQALLEEGTDWLALARQIYRRRYGAGAAADRQETQRRAAFLLRRGFDAATVRAITHADDVDDSAEEFD